MSNKMWGGRFTERPDAIMEEINVSIDVDRHLYAQDIAASKAHAAMLAAQGILTAKRCEKYRTRSRHDFVRNRLGIVRFQARARGHSHECRKPARRTDRPRRRAAAHRALAQRSGGDRLPALRSRHHRCGGCGAGRVPVRVGRAGAATRRHGDARLHPSADRPAGDLGASSSGLCRDGIARPRPLRRCPQAPQRIPARRRGACRHLVPDRPSRDRQGAWLRTADGQFARRGVGSRLCA